MVSGMSAFSRLADRLAVVDRLGVGQQFQVGFDAVGDLEQDVAALAASVLPHLSAAAWAASSASSTSSAVERAAWV
jgi:hypothetical protein